MENVMEYFLFYLCIFIMLVTLGYTLYLKKKNKKKTDSILYRSLGGILFSSYFASSAI